MVAQFPLESFKGKIAGNLDGFLQAKNPLNRRLVITYLDKEKLGYCRLYKRPEGKMEMTLIAGRYREPDYEKARTFKESPGWLDVGKGTNSVSTPEKTKDSILKALDERKIKYEKLTTSYSNESGHEALIWNELKIVMDQDAVGVMTEILNLYFSEGDSKAEIGITAS